LGRKLARDIINAGRADQILQTFSYPTDLGEHGIMMNFKDYTYAGTRGTNFNVGKTTKASVSFPIPANLVDNISINVGTAELGAIGGVVMDVMSNANSKALGTITEGLKDYAENTFKLGGSIASDVASGQFKNAIDSIGQATSSTYNVANYFGRNLVDAALPGAGVAAEAINGNAINPHVTIDFNGVSAKKHSFNWVFSPKNREESELLREIVRVMKYHAHPRYKSVLPEGTNLSGSTLSRGLLEYPALVDVFFFGVDPSFYYYFKPCMITNISVSYAPQGVAINAGGSPTVVLLQMDLQEASIFTQQDFESPEYSE